MKRFLGEPKSLRRIYGFSFAVTIAVLFATGFFGGAEALLTVLVLCALEIVFSFDNAVVNAKVLQKMSAFWQRAFMTVGIFIAVFGMRLVLPILLVALTANLGMDQVVRLALEQPDVYAQHLVEAHPVIASFGGIFLLMIFIEFILDHGREVHWIRIIEQPLRKVGRLRQMVPLVALVTLVLATQLLGGDNKFAVLLSGTLGLVSYLFIRSLAEIFELQQKKMLGEQFSKGAVMRAGLINFLYLEVLDASFSFDGVIGAFAITNMVLLIAAGLGVGALWVRSMTLHIVHRRTLSKYRYLDHGAHYAIGALAVMLILGIRYEIPEALTGMAGVVIVGFALYSSWRYNQKHKLQTPDSALSRA